MASSSSSSFALLLLLDLVPRRSDLAANSLLSLAPSPSPAKPRLLCRWGRRRSAGRRGGGVQIRCPSFGAPPRATGEGKGLAQEEEEAVVVGEVDQSGGFAAAANEGNGAAAQSFRNGHLQQQQQQQRSSVYSDSLSLGIREPIYEVIEVKSDGTMSTKEINRRQLLKSSGLRLRDIRSVDPSLWFMNSMPSLLVVEAALVSRIQRLEQRLMDVEPRVAALLEVLPNRLTADVLEQLRLSKQTLVELGSRAGALKQMLLDILEDPVVIRRMCVMGRNCTVRRDNNDMECSVPLEKQIAEEEEEEIEMLLENYLQRCESCHGQAERLLDSAREMEDSIAVNLSSRRLEVSRVELLLQVGTFCVAVGALVAGIFGMNLKSYLEEHVCAFWLTTAGIIIGAVAAFFLMYSYFKRSTQPAAPGNKAYQRCSR
ncbi:magnesium transporter MRS2-11, chloroplastic isoform X2 [Ananas comosus]|uniref:Magnesium transporter n=1 Tax=Ananas comosus TaxID=4615 RepID=A0A6P5FRG1_ANACO|nr:magnesium transporter MRS2-11, chloroplastic isoform X2 [Ananas comosus]